MKKDGRPQIYSDEYLLKQLQDYKKAHPGQKIRLIDLERATNIPTHIWKYRMKEYIQELNLQEQANKIPDGRGIVLPSAHDMCLKCGDNAQMIEDTFEMLLNLINTLQSYKEAASTINEIKNEYEKKIAQLELENKEKDNTIQSMNDIINHYILSSASEKKRLEHDIKENLLVLDVDHMEQFNRIFQDLLK